MIFEVEPNEEDFVECEMAMKKIKKDLQTFTRKLLKQEYVTAAQESKFTWLNVRSGDGQQLNTFDELKIILNEKAHKDAAQNILEEVNECY